MPFHGDVRSAPVPGCVDGWLALHERFGRLPLADVLGAAIGYAADGFPAVAAARRRASRCSTASPAPRTCSTREPLRAGDRVRRPGVARALAAIVEHGRGRLLRGRVRRRPARSSAPASTPPTTSARPLADWVEPLGRAAWGHDLWTIPPNSQGYLTLLGAGIAEGLPLPDDPDDRRWAHLLVEAARAAGHDRPPCSTSGADVRPLLDDAEVDRRRALVDGDRRSSLPTPVAGGRHHLPLRRRRRRRRRCR